MLEAFFEAAHVLKRLRSGPTGPYTDGYAEKLRAAGYRRLTACRYLGVAGHLGVWMEQGGVGISSLDETILAEFGEHFPSCECLEGNRGMYAGAFAGALLFMEHLREIGVIAEAQETEEDPSLPAVIQGFEEWMVRHRGVRLSTLGVYRRELILFLKAQGEAPDHYEAKGIRQFVLSRSKEHSAQYAKTVTTTVRMFLRYLVAHGLCNPNLVAAVPTIAHWKLSSLPRYLPFEDVERIVAACDPSTPIGIRDRAIILLLSRLGLRAGDVLALRCQDIDWEGANIRVAGKSRREERLPLPQDVGDALLKYLEEARPNVNDDQIFMRAKAPVGRLRTSSIVSWIVGSAMRRAGIRAHSYGAHVLRHSAATQMLRDGASLEVVGSVLRHQSPDTTAHYAKVDFSLLNQVVQPWPEEVASC